MPLNNRGWRLDALTAVDASAMAPMGIGFMDSTTSRDGFG
jgi:hypothetical protein